MLRGRKKRTEIILRHNAGLFFRCRFNKEQNPTSGIFAKEKIASFVLKKVARFDLIYKFKRNIFEENYRISCRWNCASFREFRNSGRHSARISIFYFAILTLVYPCRMKDYRASERP